MRSEALEPAPRPRWRWADLAIGIFYVIATVFYTRPIAIYPARAPENLIDPIHLSYVLASQARALLSRPWEFLQATYFYPIADNLAFSEQHAGAALIGLPAWIATGNPIVLYNTILVLSFVISAVTAYLLLKEVTGSRAAGLVGGLVYAFVPYKLSKFAHLHVLLAMWIPLLLLYLWRFARSRAWKDAIKLGAVLLLQVMTGIHVAVMAVIALAISALVVAIAVRPAGAAFLGWVKTAVAGGAALVIAAVLLWPYATLYREHPEHRRSVEEIQSYSGGVTGFVTAPGNNRFWGEVLREGRLREYGWEKALFPGAIPLLLAAAGVFAAIRRPIRRPGERFDPWPPAFIGLAIAGWGLAVGPRLHAFGIGGDEGIKFLHGFLLEIPGLGSIRVPGRFFLVTTVGLAGLAAYGTAAIVKAVPRKRAASIAAAAIVVLAGAEFTTTPALTVEAPSIPQAYRWIADQPEEPILSLPTAFVVGDDVAERSYIDESRYLWYASAHWRPMINGFSSNVPAEYRWNIEAVAEFPAPWSVDYLRELGVRYVIVHTDRLEDTPWRDLLERIPLLPSTAIAARFGAEVVLDVTKLGGVS